MRLRGFKAWRPPAEVAHRVACVPYDTVNTEEARAIAAAEPSSFMRVIRAEVDLPPAADPYSGEVYLQAAQAFARFTREGLLAWDDQPGLYVYRLTMGSHVQRAVMGCCHVEDYERGVVRKHERTRAEKVNDRVRLMRSLRAHTGPVFLMYRDDPAIDDRVAYTETTAPLFDFVSDDAVGHALWKVPAGVDLETAFRGVPVAYIADGHHRAAAAAQVGAELRAENPAHSGHEEYNWFLAGLFPAHQLQVLSYNRYVTDLNGLEPEAFLAAVRQGFTVTANAGNRPPAPGHVSMYLAGQWYGLAWEDEGAGDPADRLDVSVLQDRLLRPILGIEDPAKDVRIGFCGGIKGPEEVARCVRSGEAAVGFSMQAVQVDQVMDIADAGRVMPPKSTWFEPKLRSGVLVHVF